MARWTIGRVRQVPPTPGIDCEDGVRGALQEDDRPEPQITVEYSGSGGWRFASATNARAAVTPYLDDEKPPRRLVVDSDGKTWPREA